MLRRGPLLAAYLNKTVLVAGDGKNFPVRGDTAKVSFNMNRKVQALGDHEQRVFTSASRQQHKILVGSDYTIPAVTQLLPEMSIGEEVHIECSSEYAYGRRGAGESLTPNQPISMTLKLHDIYRLYGDPHAE